MGLRLASSAIKNIRDIVSADPNCARKLACHAKHNLVPRTHESFGQRQDTKLWNNQFPDSKILVVPVSRLIRALVYNMAPSDKVDVDSFYKRIQYASTSTLSLDAKRHVGSRNGLRYTLSYVGSKQFLELSRT